MKRHWYSNWDFYFVTPIILLIVVVALGSSLLAAYENYRVWKATGQIARIISVANDIHFPTDYPSSRALGDFYARLAREFPADVQQVASSADGSNYYSLQTPWGEAIRLTMVPSARTFLLDTRVSLNACRRLLFFFADNPEKLVFLRSAEMKLDGQSRAQTIYQEPTAGEARKLTTEQINIGCGNDASGALSLIFTM